MIIIFTYLFFLFFVYKRLFFYSLFFQQENYRTVKFIKFIFSKFQLIDKKLSVLVFFYVLFATVFKNYFVDNIVLSFLFLLFAVLTSDPCSIKFKKKLILTSRVKYIIYGAFVLLVLFTIYPVFYLYKFLYLGNDYCICKVWGYLIFFIQFIPLSLILSNILLLPLEIFLKFRYMRKAKLKLLKLNPVIIGVTGSFGKTSTKNILNHILSSVSSSFTTSKSINTLIGISRVILEEFNLSYKYFIVEMGTDGVGQIGKLCKLCKPKYGILTAVGNSHLENFKTKDNIAKEKFSLINYIIKNNGEYIINKNTVDKEYIENYVPNYSEVFSINDIKTNLSGISFNLLYENNSYSIFSPIFGEHQAQNIALSFIMALKLGVPVDTIIASLATLPQIEHRLEVKNQDDNITVIDDAFNSNFDGFKSALNTLQTISELKNGRAILITPGIVEIGVDHDDIHRKIAEIAVNSVDIAIVIIPSRIESFVKYFDVNRNDHQKLVLVNSLNEAREWLLQNIQTNDTILYENDLPDVFETKISI